MVKKRCRLVIIFMLLAVLVIYPSTVKAAGIVWASHTVPVPPVLLDVAADMLAAAPPAAYYAVTNVTEKQNIYVLSILGLGADVDPGDWSIDDAVWLGTVAIKSTDAGYIGGLEGSQEYDQLTRGVFYLEPPELGDPASPAGGTDGEYYTGPLLPIKPGTQAVFGPRGFHSAGYSLTGWYAIDVVSGSDLGSNAAPNMVYGAADGQISYVCKDAVSVAVVAGDYLYAHIVDNSNLITGYQVKRGVGFGSLVTGNTNDSCGWTTQQPNHWHVHFGFNPSNTSYLANYQIDINGSRFIKAGESYYVGDTLTNLNLSSGDNPGTDPGELTGDNFWDGIVSGFVGFVNKQILTTLPNADKAVENAAVFINAGGVTLRIFFVILASNFKLGVFAFVVIAILIMESVRLPFIIYRLILKLFPTAG